jgi:hypothetical protein
LILFAGSGGQESSFEKENLEKYYNILGLGPDATIEQIKSAFRVKAKLLHPDVNKSPTAHEEFILLNEAYSYLINLKTGRIRPATRPGTPSPGSYTDYDDWRMRERERVREQARRYADMKFSEFANSDFYKTLTAVNVIMDSLVIIVVIALLASPLIGFFIGGFAGLGVGLGLVFITTPVWARFFVDKRRKIRFDDLKVAVVSLLKSKSLLLFLLIFFNIFMIFRYAFNTLLSVLNINLVYFAAISLGVLASFFVKRKFLKALLIAGIAPVLVNLFFFLNFIFSAPPVTETYAFTNELQGSGRDAERTTNIILDGNKYEDYQDIRIFWDYNKMVSMDSISYQISEGLFGIRVMKSYQFKHD